MTSQKTALKQALAALGVIVSLVFVGLEIRVNTQVARAAAVLAISDQALEWQTTAAEDDEFIRIMADLRSGAVLDELSPFEWQKYNWYAASSVRVMHNRYAQVQLGVISADDFDFGGGRFNVSWWRDPIFISWWRSTDQVARWSPDFIDFFETELMGIR